jgi:hypothetical protein
MGFNSAFKVLKVNVTADKHGRDAALAEFGGQE